MMRINRTMLVMLSSVMIGAAETGSAQTTPQESTQHIDLSTLTRRARIDSLDDRTISADLRAFEERRRKGKGAFIGPDELDALRPRQFQDLFAGRNDVVAVDQTPTLQMRGQLRGAPFCRPDIFVDNLWISNNRSAVSLTQLDQQWGAESVVAVEIYESPWIVPDGFAVMRGGSCGLIAIWTSRRASVER